ncbi:hypothetical protein, partial [Candidatus Binatus sp.]|uniref:hypothetical protein n=1 Tax=Candidatus Binatus sp. TaxID=2811406 RepID=UPI003CBE86B3
MTIVLRVATHAGTNALTTPTIQASPTPIGMIPRLIGRGTLTPGSAGAKPPSTSHVARPPSKPPAIATSEA